VVSELDRDDELLGADEVARRLGVEPVTVYRWCRQGRLPCLKPGKSWRIRRSAFEAFLRRSERPRTLAAHLGAFLTVPDQVLATTESAHQLVRLDAAFFQVAEATGGLLVKLHDPKAAPLHALRQQLQQQGVDVEHLQESGRLRWCSMLDPDTAVATLRELLVEVADGDRPVWAAIDWGNGTESGAALRQQSALAALVATYPLVVMTGAVESAVDVWPPVDMHWELLGSLRGLIRFGRAGLVLSRVAPPPVG
jgi:excisionase family DNA binding protein